MMKRSCLLTGVAALAIVLCQGSQVFGYTEYYSRRYYKHDQPDYQTYESSGSADASVHYNSMPSGGWLGLSLENGEGYSATSGRADASNLNLGSFSSAISTPNNYRADSRMYTMASNRFTVSPGTSGLSNGDIVTLEIRIRLDGSLFAAGTPHPGTSDGAQADVTAGLAIYDGYSNQIVDFDAAGQMWGITSWLMSSGDFIFSSGWTESWQTSSNISSGISHTDSGRQSEYGGGEHAASHYFDTGLLDLQFEAVVGQTLDIDFFLNTQVYAGGDMQASADFYNTFAFDLTPTVAEAQIDWEIPLQAQPVPLPGGLPLLGSGLLGLLGLRRKQARDQG